MNAFADPLLLSLKVATGALVLMVGPGVFWGWLLARREFPGKVLVDALIHAPLVVPPVVTGYLGLLLLGRNGPLGEILRSLGISQLPFTWQGAALIGAVVGSPLLVRSVRLAVELVDPHLEQAAAVIGAGPWQRFWRVTVPLAMPGILGGLVLGFARALGEFGATITFAGNVAGETRTLPLAIFSLMQVPGRENQALVLALVSVGLSVAALAASDLFNKALRRRIEG